MVSGEYQGTVESGGDGGRLEGGTSSRGAAATQPQLMDATWECELLVAISPCFREDSDRLFSLCSSLIFKC